MLKNIFSGRSSRDVRNGALGIGPEKARRRVMVIGLDCAAPELVFDRWLDDLPNLKSICRSGLHGPLRSCDPPITVPAWSVMMSSKSPGRLGVYGFRNRADYSYDRYSIANSLAIKEDRLWDILSQSGKRCIVIGVPGTYPPRPLNGLMVTDFLTPDTTCQYTHPPELKQEIERVVGEYVLDVRDFRSGNKEKILADIYEMTRKRFHLARHLLARKDWDFFMIVEMGTDRIHHAFWDNMDPAHRFYEPGNKFEKAIHDYYIEVDREIGELLAFADQRTAVLVVSDHGAKRMDGGICINEWLIANGYLALAEKPAPATPLSKVKVDWSQTKAWGDGGYYARVFLNVAGREPNGTIAPGDYENMRDELSAGLKAITDEKGNEIGTQVFRPEELYNEVRGVAPDLIVYFGRLYWRSVGMVGGGKIHTFENDTGPDGANHAENGIFLFRPANGGLTGGRRIDGLRIIDIAPMILQLFDLPVPVDMEGRALASADLS
ncbi:MAG TPA: alkaline phosphatase family protein [Pyrinomonadaceae bacterium]|jgi:predicted AlkP superfamily phosphohydrolase/phosphomutase|nr:alkaline phosphatase family protein [Pyrinomonadaceae bacterium]